MLIDTDVLIWYLRGNPKAYTFIEKLDGFNISVITYMELIQGMRNKNELTRFRKRFHEWNARILHLTEDISARAMIYVEKCYLSHSLELADALIAATALINGMKLATCNEKHYRPVTEVELISIRVT